MKKRILLAILLAGSPSLLHLSRAMDQKNIDTPNLDFSLGEMGWTYQTG